jgi:hypothetical protein
MINTKTSNRSNRTRVAVLVLLLAGVLAAAALVGSALLGHGTGAGNQPAVAQPQSQTGQPADSLATTTNGGDSQSAAGDSSSAGDPGAPASSPNPAQSPDPQNSPKPPGKPKPGKGGKGNVPIIQQTPPPFWPPGPKKP